MVSPGVPPSLLASYEILALLGTGGMGSVFKAKQLTTGRIVALKTLQDSDSAIAVKRFQREAKMLSSLKHPNIVEAWTFGITDEGQAYLTMEYVEGISLAAVLKRDGRLPLERFRSLFAQVISGLKHAHQHQVIHRDLKPDNIMLMTAANGAESVKLVDFGIARPEDIATTGGKLTQDGSLLGTLNYMSPEHFKGQRIDARADIYSLGCVMYEALTGAPPYQISTPAEAMIHSADCAEFLPNLVAQGVPQWLDRLIEICLSRDPEFRYQSTALLEADFAANHVSLGSKSTPPVKGPSSTKRPTKVPTLILGLLALVTVAGFGTTFWLNSIAPAQTDMVNNFEAQYAQGTKDLNKEQWDSAISHFSSADSIEKQINPTDQILNRLAEAELAAGKMAAKHGSYDLAFELSKKSHTHYLKGSWFKSASETAIDASEAIWKLGKNATPAMLQSALAMCNALEGKQLTTRQATELRVAQGRLLMKLGQPKEAMAKLEEAVSRAKLAKKDDPESDLPTLPLAYAEDRLGKLLAMTNPSLAVEHFDKAAELYTLLAEHKIKQSSNYEHAIDAQNDKAVLPGLSTKDRLQARTSAVNLATRCAHRHLPSFQYSLAELQLERGDAAAALALANQVISVSNDKPNQHYVVPSYLRFRAWLLLSNAYIAKGDVNEAISALNHTYLELQNCPEADIRDVVLTKSAASDFSYLKGDWEQSAKNARRGLSHLKTVNWAEPAKHPDTYRGLGEQELTARLNLQLAKAEFKAGNKTSALAALIRIEKLPDSQLPEKLAAHSLQDVIRRNFSP